MKNSAASPQKTKNSIRLVFPSDSYALIKSAAESKRMSFSQFVREVSHVAAKRVLEADDSRPIGEFLLEAPPVLEAARKRRSSRAA